jgi:ribosomal protein L32
MAQPKYKLSRASTRARRAQWFANRQTVTLSECPNCRRKKLAHHGCAACGYYDGKFFKATKEEAK